jgi:Domain of unknown function (DUF4352)
MSIAPPGPPEAPQPTSPAPPEAAPVSRKDAKAHAAAAKAYAKAQRPWWQKKRFIVPVGLVVLAVAVSSVSGGDEAPTLGSPPGNAAATSESGSGSAASKPSEATAVVGQTIENAATRYEVTDVQMTDRLRDGHFRENAEGVFVVVSLELTNTKNETATFMESSAQLVTADGSAYDTSDEALFAIDSDDSLVMEDIQPDLTAKGKLVFDIPPDRASGSTLVIEDLFGDGAITVDLGL